MIYLVVLSAAYLVAWLWRERLYAKQTREERHAFRLERTALLQRVQAPERAVREVNREKGEKVPYVAPESDADFARLREARNGRAD